MYLIPLIKIDDAKPATSPTTPPPTANTNDDLSKCFFAISFTIKEIDSNDFAFSP